MKLRCITKGCFVNNGKWDLDQSAYTISLLAKGQSKGLEIFRRYLMFTSWFQSIMVLGGKRVFIYVTAGTNSFETLRIICLVIFDLIYYNKVL